VEDECLATGSELAVKVHEMLFRPWVLGTIALLAIAAALFVLRSRERTFDPRFDAAVAEPAYAAGSGPLVLFDDSPRSVHTTAQGYKPLADLLRADGFRVQGVTSAVDATVLGGAAILILPPARGANDTNDGPAFTEGEIDAVDAWVRGGGSLLLVSDHWPYGSSVASLANRLGVAMGAGLVQDSTHHDAARGDSHLVFSDGNGLLGDHPIVRGRAPGERVRRVLTFTGQSVAGHPSVTRFLALSDAATERPPGPATATRDGGDVRVTMEYGAPLSAAGRAQGIAFEAGAGRVVVLGEAGMLRAQREKNGNLVGMNVPDYDNRQLALNIVRWLSRAL
jgi:hypothetical protein